MRIRIAVGIVLLLLGIAGLAYTYPEAIDIKQTSILHVWIFLLSPIAIAFGGVMVLLNSIHKSAWGLALIGALTLNGCASGEYKDKETKMEIRGVVRVFMHEPRLYSVLVHDSSSTSYKLVSINDYRYVYGDIQFIADVPDSASMWLSATKESNGGVQRISVSHPLPRVSRWWWMESRKVRFWYYQRY